LLVSDIVSSVRPWNPRSKATMARGPVAARAIFTAFSTASGPELNSTLRCSAPRQGESSPSRRHTSTYGS
jgi:hypothetical protein